VRRGFSSRHALRASIFAVSREIDNAERPTIYFRRGEEKEFSVRRAVFDVAQKGKSYRSKRDNYLTIEKDFDVPFIAGLALREKQIQQNYRPIIAIHKWFARRPGTLFRGLLLSEFGTSPIRELFYRTNNFKGKTVCDPFMGGGTPLIEANRVGCDTYGWDINPMSWWIVREEIEHLDLAKYRKTAQLLIEELEHEIGFLYKTTCSFCGSEDALVKYFLWVKTLPCRQCATSIDLFPGYLIAENRRHPNNVFVCRSCGELVEAESRADPGNCHYCGNELRGAGPAAKKSCLCPNCGFKNIYPNPSSGPPDHRLFAIEYHCRACYPHHRGRFFKKPDEKDHERTKLAETKRQKLNPQFVPDEAIPKGDETDRLHRWGYKRYLEMFNYRQLLGLELSSRFIVGISDARIRNALATNLSDLLRYQNMLCRYDTMALKSLDIFSVHGFPVGLIACESNFLGIPKNDGTNIGSGGWSNIIEKYSRAKAYCDRPFEIDQNGRGKIQIVIPDEWIGDKRNGDSSPDDRLVVLQAASSTEADLPKAILDAVLTDPPYFGNVQYAELMDFCYVWLRRIAKTDQPAFSAKSTRNINELTGNETLARGLEHFTSGLSKVFIKMAQALKPGAPFAFTYHHNRVDAYFPLAVAILDAGLVCSATLPCPAEMSASIHISGTGSSIVDTIFVNRSTGRIPRRWIVDSPEGISELVKNDMVSLRMAGLKPTQGDMKCVIYGHLLRLAIWGLRSCWDSNLLVSEKLAIVRSKIDETSGLDLIMKALGPEILTAPIVHAPLIFDETTKYLVGENEISF